MDSVEKRVFYDFSTDEGTVFVMENGGMIFNRGEDQGRPCMSKVYVVSAVYPDGSRVEVIGD